MFGKVGIEIPLYATTCSTYLTFQNIDTSFTNKTQQFSTEEGRDGVAIKGMKGLSHNTHQVFYPLINIDID